MFVWQGRAAVVVMVLSWDEDSFTMVDSLLWYDLCLTVQRDINSILYTEEEYAWFYTCIGNQIFRILDLRLKEERCIFRQIGVEGFDLLSRTVPLHLSLEWVNAVLLQAIVSGLGSCCLWPHMASLTLLSVHIIPVLSFSFWSPGFLSVKVIAYNGLKVNGTKEKHHWICFTSLLS